MAEFKEFSALNKAPTTFFHAAPLESDLFEWHFSVRGPPDTPFADGVYHGRIVLPAEYPLKPPEIILLTPNGRFETGKRICLSVTAHHQETWQPSWGIRTILTALVGFMPSKAEGVAALDFPDSDRRRMARSSWSFRCNRCDACPIQQLHVPAAVNAGFPGAYAPPCELKNISSTASSSSSSSLPPAPSQPETLEPLRKQSEVSGTPEKSSTPATTKVVLGSASSLSPPAAPPTSITTTPTSQSPSLPAYSTESDVNTSCNSDDATLVPPSVAVGSIVTDNVDNLTNGDLEPSPRLVIEQAEGMSRSSPTPTPPASNITPTTSPTRQASTSTTVKERELLYLAYAIAIAIVAIILRRVYVTVTMN